MSSTERISFLQEKLQEIRKYYMTLKSEVASIDRRRKRLKKKEREGRPLSACWEMRSIGHVTVSFQSLFFGPLVSHTTSSGSSDTGMSPSSASPTQSTVAVECR